MKWFSILSVCAIAVFATACEKHPAAELPQEHAAGGHHAETKGEAKEPEHPAEAAKPEGAKPEDEPKPGEAPKFFPENK